MTGETREMAILAMMQALNAVHPQAMTLGMAGAAAGRACGLKLDQRETESLLVDLIDKGWAEKVNSEAAPEVSRFKRTEKGRIWLAGQ